MFLLDNTNVQNYWNRGSGSGQLGTTLGVEAIAEYQVLTNTYSAQFGGNGVAINAITKSGTNQWHGSLFEFFRNDRLDASNYFDALLGSPGSDVQQEPVRRQLRRTAGQGTRRSTSSPTRGCVRRSARRRPSPFPMPTRATASSTASTSA